MTATSGMEKENGRSPEREGRTAGPLIHAAQNRDESAFAAIYRAHCRRVLATCRAKLPRAAENDLEDCAQETWMAAGWLQGFDPGRGELLHWLRQIARRRCYDRMRAGTRRPSGVPKIVLVPLDAAEMERADSAPGPCELAERAEATRRLLAAVAALPGKRGVPVRLCFWGGMTMKEAGAKLGVTESRISQAVADGIRMLRRRAVA